MQETEDFEDEPQDDSEAESDASSLEDGTEDGDDESEAEEASGEDDCAEGSRQPSSAGALEDDAGSEASSSESDEEEEDGALPAVSAPEASTQGSEPNAFSALFQQRQRVNAEQGRWWAQGYCIKSVVLWATTPHTLSLPQYPPQPSKTRWPPSFSASSSIWRRN